jgi:transcriptional regulator with XRE-family HTH domain
MNYRIPDIKSVVATNLVRFRKSSKLTQLQVAEKINYSDKALSKWERGESLPDVCVLKQLADIYNVELDAVLHEESTREKLQDLSRNKVFISILSVLLVWLIAMITYVIFEMIAPGMFETWLIFIYAIPVSAIVALVFNNVWGNRIYNMVIVSALDWGVSLSLVITLRDVAPTSWYLYFVSAIFELMVIIWYLLDLSKYTEERKNKRKIAREAQAKHKEDLFKKAVEVQAKKNLALKEKAEKSKEKHTKEKITKN